jgi:hypothetical protein
MQHDTRSVAHIALVDEWCRPICSLFIKQEIPVASYLTPVTGLTKEIIDDLGVPFVDALAMLQLHLSSNAVLVGHDIRKTVHWLDLVQGLHFACMVDLVALFKVWDSKLERWTIFCQDHVAKCWLGLMSRSHFDVLADATISMSLFNAYRHCQYNPEALAMMRIRILTTPRTLSLSATTPSIDGCCLGNKGQCTCGAPFL